MDSTINWKLFHVYYMIFPNTRTKTLQSPQDSHEQVKRSLFIAFFSLLSYLRLVYIVPNPLLFFFLFNFFSLNDLNLILTVSLKGH